MSGKRAFDLVFAAMGLALFAPLLLIILVLILLEDGAPVTAVPQLDSHKANLIWGSLFSLGGGSGSI
ncbi:MAG: sugar transferase, partial [Candidatus Thiodiazotropha endolucinida]|nr:sugar transferase [Candidatus Thiodiazotropha endolucinida]